MNELNSIQKDFAALVEKEISSNKEFLTSEEPEDMDSSKPLHTALKQKPLKQKKKGKKEKKPKTRNKDLSTKPSTETTEKKALTEEEKIEEVTGYLQELLEKCEDNEEGFMLLDKNDQLWQLWKPPQSTIDEFQKQIEKTEAKESPCTKPCSHSSKEQNSTTAWEAEQSKKRKDEMEISKLSSITLIELSDSNITENMDLSQDSSTNSKRIRPYTTANSPKPKHSSTFTEHHHPHTEKCAHSLTTTHNTNNTISTMHTTNTINSININSINMESKLKKGKTMGKSQGRSQEYAGRSLGNGAENKQQIHLQRKIDSFHYQYPNKQCAAAPFDNKGKIIKNRINAQLARSNFTNPPENLQNGSKFDDKYNDSIDTSNSLTYL